MKGRPRSLEARHFLGKKADVSSILAEGLMIAETYTGKALGWSAKPMLSSSILPAISHVSVV